MFQASQGLTARPCFDTQITSKETEVYGQTVRGVVAEKREIAGPRGFGGEGRGEEWKGGEEEMQWLYPAFSRPGHRRKHPPLRTKPESEIVFCWVLHTRAR